MAKSDLLKEAIADAKAVKETAIANAKLALQEAFAPRIQSMLSARLHEELDDEELEGEAGMEAGMEDMDADMDMDAELEGGEMGSPESVGVGLDFNADGEYDLTGTVGAEEEDLEGMEDMDMDAEAGMEDMGAEAGMEMEDDLDLAEIIRELEEGMYEEEAEEPEMVEQAAAEDGDGMLEEDIDAIIESILAEEDDMEEEPESNANAEMEAELNEAYSTIKQLRSVINEVNLLNAKLLYTNKLFRNFELNESQKMKVIENFDRAANTREVKLVFSTLAESFNKPTVKRVVKESYASKPTRTTAPSTETKQIISEGNELANRWKKLAGLL